MIADTPLAGEEKVRRGQRARELLADPLIVEALVVIEGGAILSWRYSASNEPEKRERAWYLMKAAELFRAALTEAVTTGRMEEDKAERNG